MGKTEKTIDNLGRREREKYDCLHALRQLEQNNGRQSTNDAYLDQTMDYVARQYPGVVKIKRRWGIGREEYRLTEKGYQMLESETKRIQKLQRELEVQGLKGEAIDDRLETTLSLRGTNTGEYIIGKMLLCDGGFDQEKPGYFSRKTKDLGKDVATKLRNDKRLRRNASQQSLTGETSVDTYNNDILLYYLLFSNTSNPIQQLPDYEHKRAESSNSGCGGGYVPSGCGGGIDSKSSNPSHGSSGSWFSSLGSESGSSSSSSSGCGGGSSSGSSGCGGGGGGCGGGGCGGGGCGGG